MYVGGGVIISKSHQVLITLCSARSSFLSIIHDQGRSEKTVSVQARKSDMVDRLLHHSTT